jgi:catechol-2,3-dioxygenase
MPNISRVGHVVLMVSNVDQSLAFYRDVLGMELVRYDSGPRHAFMSFGRQHHDIGLFEVKTEPTHGSIGLSHIAVVINGGYDELVQHHEHAKAHGAEMAGAMDYGMTKGFYIKDPDGHRIEVYCDLMEPMEGKSFMANRPEPGKSFTFEPAGSASN